MSKNKLKHIATPKKILMETYHLDEASVTVLLRDLHRSNISLSCEDNILYAINNDNTKVAVDQNDNILLKISELQKFIAMSDNTNLIINYLYEKIKNLETKASNLEQENRKLTDDIWTLENKNDAYHD